ncbi:hypothetical protein ACSQ67_020007 [Phaseolus vulgaris]
MQMIYLWIKAELDMLSNKTDTNIPRWEKKVKGHLEAFCIELQPIVSGTQNPFQPLPPLISPFPPPEPPDSDGDVRREVPRKLLRTPSRASSMKSLSITASSRNREGKRLYSVCLCSVDATTLMMVAFSPLRRPAIATWIPRGEHQWELER